MPLAYSLVSMVLDMTQMVLAVPKHQQMINMIMLDNSYYYNFPIKSIPLEVLALGRHLGVFSARYGTHGPGCLKTPSNDQSDNN